MKNWIYLAKLIRRFGINAVNNAASDLFPTEKESVSEYNRRLKMYQEVGR